MIDGRIQVNVRVMQVKYRYEVSVYSHVGRIWRVLKTMLTLSVLKSESRQANLNPGWSYQPILAGLLECSKQAQAET